MPDFSQAASSFGKKPVSLQHFVEGLEFVRAFYRGHRHHPVRVDTPQVERVHVFFQGQEDTPLPVSQGYDPSLENGSRKMVVVDFEEIVVNRLEGFSLGRHQYFGPLLIDVEVEGNQMADDLSELLLDSIQDNILPVGPEDIGADLHVEVPRFRVHGAKIVVIELRPPDVHEG